MRSAITPCSPAVLLAATLLASVISTVGCGSSTSTATAPATLPRCSVTASPMDISAPPQGTSGQLTIKTARECAWSAASEASWLTIQGSPGGQGDGTVEYVVSTNSDPVTRRGTIAVNDQHPAISQAAADCVIRLRAPAASFPVAGGSGSVDVEASSALCSWTAASEAAWIVIRSAVSGSGNATVRFDVAATSGQSRTGSLVIGGQRFTITQVEGCSYSIAPENLNATATGGAFGVSVITASVCPWTATSNVNWIAITSGTSGTGNASVQFTVEATTASRAGTLTIAGQSFTVNQTQSCAVSIASTAANVASAAGNGAVNVMAPNGCTWTAIAGVSWITITSGNAGSGNGTVSFSVAANTGGTRTGTITISGQLYTVSQAGSCSYSVAPGTQNIQVSGGAGSLTVNTTQGCAWTASSSASWVALTSGASGTGNAAINFTAAANTGPPRSATIAVQDQTATIQQASGCVYSLQPTSQTVGASPSTGSVALIVTAGCTWTAIAQSSWLTITSGASGAGPGTITYAATANAGGSRTGTLMIAGLTFTVNQAGSCMYSIDPIEDTVRKQGDQIRVDVTTSSGCGWTAMSPVPWIQVESGASGTGSGRVVLDVDRNNDNTRTANVTIAGLTFKLTQEGK